MRHGEAAEVNATIYLRSKDGTTRTTEEWLQIANDWTVNHLSHAAEVNIHCDTNESHHRDITLGSVDEESGEVTWEES